MQKGKWNLKLYLRKLWHFRKRWLLPLLTELYDLLNTAWKGKAAVCCSSSAPTAFDFPLWGLPLRPLFRKTVLPAEKTLLPPTHWGLQGNRSACRWSAARHTSWPCACGYTSGVAVPKCRWVCPPARPPWIIILFLRHSARIAYGDNRSSFPIVQSTWHFIKGFFWWW